MRQGDDAWRGDGFDVIERSHVSPSSSWTLSGFAAVTRITWMSESEHGGPRTARLV